MATEVSRSKGSAADSYIGTLISLTSKSEIRYEGVLYNIDTDDSSIGLRDVRSFGTEGRKKDGPQFPPSDRVYEFILFRGSDIKDLQVKTSPAIHTSSPVNNDPAIIQSQHTRYDPTPTSLPTSAVSSTAVTSIQTSLLEQPAPNVHNGAPLYQPGGNVGTWGPSPSSANGSGNAMPMYWQGYYATPGGKLSHQTQQPLMWPPGLSALPLLQQQTNHYLQHQMPPLQLPSSLQHQVTSSLQPQMSLSLQSQMPSSLQPQIPASSLQSQMPSSLQQQMPSSFQSQISSSPQKQIPDSLQQMTSFLQQQLPSSLHQPMPSLNHQMPSSLHQPLHYPYSSTPTVNSTLPAPLSLFTPGTNSEPSGIITSTSSATSTFPPTFPLLPVTSLALDAAASSLIPTKTPIAAPVLNTSPATSLLPASCLLGAGLDGNTVLQPLSSKPTTTTGQISQQNANVPQSTPSKVVAGNRISTQAPAPALLTPGHLLKSSSISSAPSSQVVHKYVEVVKVSSSPAVELPALGEPERKPSVLPLATPSGPLYKQIGSSVQSYSGYRGCGRGRGRMNSRPLTAFNEEFDFIAMNEKFKKDEVWGHLGKSSKTHDQQEDGKHADEEFSQHKDVDFPKIDIKPVYNKDDFFDSLSSNAQGQESNHSRHRFSEQRKIDTETFGELSRYRGGRGGHRPGRGNYRGSLNGRGYGRGGYGYGRGRGPGGPNTVS